MLQGYEVEQDQGVPLGAIQGDKVRRHAAMNALGELIVAASPETIAKLNAMLSSIVNIEVDAESINLNTDGLENKTDALSVAQIHAKILAADDMDINYTVADGGTVDERITSATYDGTIDLVADDGTVSSTAKQTTDTYTYSGAAGGYYLTRKVRTVTV